MPGRLIRSIGNHFVVMSVQIDAFISYVVRIITIVISHLLLVP